MCALPIPGLASPSIAADVPKVALVLVAPVLFTGDEVNQRLHLITVFPVKEAKTNQEIHQFFPIAAESWFLSTTPTAGGI